MHLHQRLEARERAVLRGNERRRLAVGQRLVPRLAVLGRRARAVRVHRVAQQREEVELARGGHGQALLLGVFQFLCVELHLFNLFTLLFNNISLCFYFLIDISLK